jgi:electron transfer flavoprotein beta subunit
LLFGNEAADTGDYQVGIRVAHALDLPCVTGIKALEIRNGTAMARREATGGWEVFEVTLPAVFTVKEGINLPRYPSLPGRLRAKKKEIEQHPHPRPEAPTPRGHPTQGVPARPRESPRPPWNGGGLEKVRLKIPREEHSGAEILGEGPATAPKIVEILKELGLV